MLLINVAMSSENAKDPLIKSMVESLVNNDDRNVIQRQRKLINTFRATTTWKTIIEASGGKWNPLIKLLSSLYSRIVAWLFFFSLYAFYNEPWILLTFVLSRLAMKNIFHIHYQRSKEIFKLTINAWAKTKVTDRMTRPTRKWCCATV